MQVKVVIGTISFMLTMMILGFAALREPARLEEFTLAFEGRSAENGARIYFGNCATCHGVEGRAEKCLDTAGNETGCKGLPLNYAPLLCGDKSQRMEAMQWEGSKKAYLEQAVSSGRLGTVMPTWSVEFGGPMRRDQIQDVVAFIMNWESEELCSEPLVTYEWPQSITDYQAEFGEGDAVNGANLYVKYGCFGCHGDPAVEGTNAVGPWLGQIADIGATRIEGYTAADYIYESILDPNAYIVDECPTGPCADPSAMAGQNFGLRMSGSPQDMADILAYLLEQGN
ncbi:MAG: c-type cytochrome [Anaerolineae bacterium]